MRTRTVTFAVLTVLILAAGVAYLTRGPASKEYAPPSQQARSTHTEEVDLPPFPSAPVSTASPTLPPPKENEVRVFGTAVFDDDDSPVSGADINLAGFPDDGLDVRTDSHGAFAFNVGRGTLDGFRTLSCYTPGYAMDVQTIDVASLRQNATEVELHFRLKEGGSVVGRVVLDASGEGVGNVEVFATCYREGDALDEPETLRRQGSSGPDGSYVVDGLPPGLYHMWANGTKAGFPPGKGASTQVEVREARAYAVPDLKVTRGGQLTGVVKNVDGDPVEGAQVQLVPAQGESRARSSTHAVTAEDGSFELMGVVYSAVYDLTANAAGYVKTVVDGVSLSHEAPAAPLEVVLLRGARISGEVVHPDGQFASRVMVQLRVLGASLAHVEDGNRDQMVLDAGKFSFTDLAAGAYELSVYGHDFLAPDTTPLDIDLEPGEARRGIRLVIDAKEAAAPQPPNLWGKVVDQDGERVPHASMSVVVRSEPYPNSIPVRTNDEGEFSVGIHLEDPADLVVFSARGNAVIHDVPFGQALTVVVRDTLGIGGTVVGPDGRPVADCSVELKPDFGVLAEDPDYLATMMTNPPGSDKKTTDARGRFLFKPVQAGTYVIEARGPDHLLGTTDPFEVEDFATRQGVVVRVNDGGIVSGTVTDDRGQPILGAQVSAARLVEDPALRAVLSSIGESDTPRVSITDDRGAFLLRGLDDGEYRIHASHVDYAAPAPVVKSIQRGQEIHGLRLELKAGGCITGTVDLSRTLDAAVVRASGNGREQTDMTQPDGAFNVCKLEPGNYLVYLQPRTLQRNASHYMVYPLMATQAARVRTGAKTRVDFAPLPEPATVSGTLSATSMSMVYVNLRNLAIVDGGVNIDGVTTLRATRENGFTFSSVPPGQYVLEVTQHSDGVDPPLYQGQLDIGPGEDLRLELAVSEPGGE